MTYLFQNATAFDPYTGQGVPNASGQVFAMSDTGFVAPLAVTTLSSGLQTTELVSDQYSQLPGFDAGDNVQVRFRSGEFTKVLNTSTPLVGPQGLAGKSAFEVAVEGGYAGTEAEYNAALTDMPSLTDRAEAAEQAATAAAGLVTATSRMITLGEPEAMATGHIISQSVALGRINHENAVPLPAGESTVTVNGETIFMAFPYSGLDYRKPTALVVHYQGAGGGSWPTTSWRPMMQAAIDAGYMFVSSSMGGNTFGGPPLAGLTRDMVTAIAQRFPISDIVVSAESLGTISALNAIGRGVIHPLGLFLCQPTVDLGGVYAYGDPYATEMRAVFGISADGSNLDTATAKYDPTRFPPEAFRGVPTYMRASLGDTLVKYVEHGKVLEGILAGYSTVYFSFATGDHGDASHFIPADYLTFLATHAPQL